MSKVECVFHGNDNDMCQAYSGTDCCKEDKTTNPCKEHKRWPCKICGTSHFKGCKCSFCS